MKKRDTLLLGELEVMPLQSFRKAPGDVFAQVQMGKVFVLTKQGKPMAVLSQPPGATLAMHIDKTGEWSYAL